MDFELNQATAAVIEQMAHDPVLAPYVHFDLPPPQPFRGSGPIRLIVLGQDPTIQNSKKQITTVLNLDHKSSLVSYLSKVCKSLGWEMKENLYATNLCKNFFIQPPTALKKQISLIKLATPYWLPLLQQELTEFPGAPVIVLGNPVLAQLVKPQSISDMKHYWGYVTDWKQQTLPPQMSHIAATDTYLQRDIFPLPHVNSKQHLFYQQHLPHYLNYLRQVLRPN